MPAGLRNAIAFVGSMPTQAGRQTGELRTRTEHRENMGLRRRARRGTLRRVMRKAGYRRAEGDSFECRPSGAYRSPDKVARRSKCSWTLPLCLESQDPLAEVPGLVGRVDVVSSQTSGELEFDVVCGHVVEQWPPFAEHAGATADRCRG